LAGDRSGMVLGLVEVATVFDEFGAGNLGEGEQGCGHGEVMRYLVFRLLDAKNAGV
jgi:hypothetical protein